MPTKLADGLGLRDVPLLKMQIRPKLWFLRSVFSFAAKTDLANLLKFPQNISLKFMLVNISKGVG